MALKRFSENDPVINGTADTDGNVAAKMSFVIPVQPSATETDKKMTLQQFMVIPQFSVGAFTDGIASATCTNYQVFTPIEGQILDFTFTGDYEGTTQPSIRINNKSFPVKTQGADAGSHFCKSFNTSSQRSIRGTIRANSSKELYIDLDTFCQSTADDTLGYSVFANGDNFYIKEKLDIFFASRLQCLQILGIGTYNSKEVTLNSPYGLLYVWGWFTSGSYYTHLYVVSRDTRYYNIIVNKIADCGEVQNTNNVIESNYSKDKIKLISTNYNIHNVYFMPF